MSIVGGYVVRQYLRVFAFTLFAGLTLFAVVDAVDRVADYAQYGPSAAALLAFYLLRLPLIVTNVFPAVCLLSVLLSLGLLARSREITAMRSCGFSDWQIGAPLLLLSAALSAGAFFWNEIVVPRSAAEARHVKDVVIKKKRGFESFDARSIWLQNAQGFVNIEYFDAARDVIHGLTIYSADEAFRLRSIVEVPTAAWVDGVWQVRQGSVKELAADGSVHARALTTDDVTLSDTPADLAKRRPHAEEFTLWELRKRIALLRSKGLNVDELRVDLHAKLALPLSGIVSVLFGFPLAIRGGRRFGLGYNVSVGLVTGFLYWATLAFAVSAGRMGLVPPLLAAWSANAIFAGVGVVLLGARDR